MRDMTRCYSGLHFMNPELDAALKETQEQVSEVGNIFQDAIRHFLGEIKDVGGRVSLTTEILLL